ncbi:MAG: hypothetical protein H7Y86_12280, partial [Rhizobacter sp.]|nr:hypothetical protein [Ferruginibacter sp.]
MKNLFIKKLIFLLFISMNAIAQDGKFTFTISSKLHVSAGVFKNDSILVRTLWSDSVMPAGTYTRYWDGTDDNGAIITSPSTTYKIKVLTNNIKYTWQGVIGNTSDSLTGETVHLGYYHNMMGLAFGPTYGYMCKGYAEGANDISKFLIGQPNKRVEMISAATGGKADVNYVVTDGTNVYWGAFDSNAGNTTFVFATKVSDDAEVVFTNGAPCSVTFARTYPSTISKLNQNNSGISGLAVQKAGMYLFVARADLNQVQVLNKTTGALVQTLNYNTPRGLSVDGNDNLWMCTGTVAQADTVARYKVNSDGTLAAATVTILGLSDPLATQVSPNGITMAVADGGASQQVKFFNNTTGVKTGSLGTIGGYAVGATVNNSKFYFNGIPSINRKTFIAYQPDGSFWVNDHDNYRTQHYNSSNVYVDNIMTLGSTYAIYVDVNNPKRVFSDFMEFEIDYAQPPATGWKLKKNWSGNVSSAIYDGFPRNEVTLSNGRTYGLINKKGTSRFEIIEFTPADTIRFTGVLTQSLSAILCTDGSIQYGAQAGATIHIVLNPLLGFDGSNNPLYAPYGVNIDTLTTTINDEVIGNATSNDNQAFSSTGKVVMYNPSATIGWSAKRHKGYHLAVMQRGDTTLLFQTEKSTPATYSGDFPPAGYFDIGNGVGYAGGQANILDRHIITSYHGEFWRATQTNKFNHYYDNGLAFGQFGTTRPEITGRAAAMMAGNALTPELIKDTATGNLYLWHGDEGDHSGIHRWQISNLGSISEQVITIPFPSAYNAPITNYTDLMAGLPFSEVLVNNTAGWTRTRFINDGEFSSYTSNLSYDKLLGNDISVNGVLSTPNTQESVNRDLGINNVTESWKITGSYAIAGDAIKNSQGYVEVLDHAGKILTNVYFGSTYPPNKAHIYGNGVAIVSNPGFYVDNAAKPIPIEISIVNSVVTFKYGINPPVTTTILDGSGNWRTPKTFRIRFLHNAYSGSTVPQYITLQNLKFYKDYSVVAPPNKAPAANAGIDKIITLPTNSITLTGSGTDDDGTISSYAWVKIAGPSTGTIVASNAATTAVNSLIQGIYQYALTVTDNNGAAGKDTIQVTVNAAANEAPVASAGNNMAITLPTNTVTVTGSATDADGTVSSYAWARISGPAQGTFITSNTATATIINLAEGLYELQLTVTDNNGATGKDTLQVLVNAAPNLAPVADAGTNNVITLPLNTATLSGKGTDPDGTISSYAWVKKSGPSAGTIATANSATTDVNNLVQGVYQYELTVTDNNGAAGKATVQVTINAASNIAPLADAGTGKTITLPINTTTLTGLGTDADGTISSYSWIKISGPVAGNIATANASTTTVNNLVQGIYQYELTVTDNNGATGKDTVQVTVNAAANIAPLAGAGTDQT